MRRLNEGWSKFNKNPDFNYISTETMTLNGIEYNLMSITKSEFYYLVGDKSMESRSSNDSKTYTCLNISGKGKNYYILCNDSIKQVKDCINGVLTVEDDIEGITYVLTNDQLKIIDYIL